MHPRRGTWLIAGASLIGLALSASAQTRPSNAFAAQPASRMAASRPAPAGAAQPRPFANLFAAAVAASAPPANAATISGGSRVAAANAAPTNAPSQSQPPPGSGNLLQLAAAAFGQTRPPTTNAPPRGNPGQSQPLPVDQAAAGRLAKSPVNARGRTVDASFISANAPAINSVQIPVLLPGDPDLAPNLRIFPNGPFYTVSSKSNGMSFVLTGAGRAFPLSPAAAKNLPGGTLASRIPPDGIVIDGSEAGLNASFNRFGASYSISLECASPLADPRCTNPAYIRGVIGRLMVIMPGTAS